MPITTPLNEKVNAKLPTAADTNITGRKVVSLEDPIQTSTLGQTTIIISTFAVDVNNIKNLFVIIDGKVLTEGSGNDFTLTNVSPNNTSNTISLTQPLVSGLNIKILYLGVVVTNSTSLDTLSPAISDTVAYSQTWTGTVSNPAPNSPTVDIAQYRRLGDAIEVEYLLTQTLGGTNGSGVYLFSLPPGMTVDPSKATINMIGNLASNLGDVFFNYSGNTEYVGFVYPYDTTHLAFWIISAYAAPSNDTTFNSAVFAFNATNSFTFKAKIPIAGLSASVISQGSRIFQASAYAANGTNVTSTPTALGQYRTYNKNISALTGTDNAPNGSYAPSNANGFRIDGSVNYVSAGTSGQPNRWEIFIGQNMYPTYTVYSGAGRTGAVNIKAEPNIVAMFYGISFDYDPTTGIVIVDAIDQPTSTTTRNAARSMPTGGSAPVDLPNVYFEINVSQNVLPVQFSDPSKAPISEIHLDGGGASGAGSGNGFGSTNTFIRYLGNVRRMVGTAITYNHSTTLGDSFVINEPGGYAISYTEYAASGGENFGITVNSTALTTRVDNMANDPFRQGFSFAANAVAGNLATTLSLNVGDVVRMHTDANGSTNGLLEFRIKKVVQE